MLTRYRSAKNRQFIVIEDMHTQHLLNAIKKVRSGTHFWYHNEDPILISLLTELEHRNAQQLAELQTVVDSYKRRQVDLRDHVGPTLHKAPVSRNILGELRSIALRIIKERGLVTADTLRSEYAGSSVESFLGLPVSDIGPALPYVFRDKRFKKIGFLRSTFGPNNGRFINVWGSAAAL
jgi:hypothetical protein